jgi:hypothetical protein
VRAVAAFISVAVGFGLAFISGAVGGVVFWAVFLGLWGILELTTARYLRQRHKLEVIQEVDAGATR